MNEVVARVWSLLSDAMELLATVYQAESSPEPELPAEPLPFEPEPQAEHKRSTKAELAELQSKVLDAVAAYALGARLQEVLTEVKAGKLSVQRALKALCKSGALEIHGTRRGAVYSLPAKAAE